MKILLFNLGPIQHRIIGWDIEGFKSLFDQDIILWGPIPDEKFIYNNKEIPILRIFEPVSIKELFGRLPGNWLPDVVTCETSVLNYIPDIYLCPVKTILFTRDAWSDTIFNRKLVELFDFLNHAVIDRSSYMNLNVRLLPLSNCAVSLPGKDVNFTDFGKREIDVVAIANYEGGFYHDRFKSFYKLACSNESDLKIKYFRGIKRADIYAYYQRSKIVIDWAHTLSNRSYEAALNGCLLFSHKDNTLIKEFWVPWEEYIPYDEENVMELITYYVDNPEQSRKVILKAKEKSMSIPSSWGDYVWENINIAHKTDVNIRERIERTESLPVSSLHYRTATPLLYNFDYKTDFPSGWRNIYFQRIDAALSSAGSRDLKIAPLIEAARLSLLLKDNELSLRYLYELEKIFPDYGWIYQMRGRIHFRMGEYDKAQLSLHKAVECCLKSPELVQEFVLPVLEKGNASDGRRITDYMWQSVTDHRNEYQVDALCYQALELSGVIYAAGGDDQKAIDSYIRAINHLPLPGCIYKANDLYVKKMDYSGILQITERGIENSPYDTILILYKAYALINLRRRREAFDILNAHRKALKSFLGVRKIVIIRYVISIMIILLFSGKQPDSKIIIEMINRLKKKSGIPFIHA